MDRPTRPMTSMCVYERGLGASEGVYLCTSGEALLKSTFESELAVSLIALPDDPVFADLLDVSRDATAQQLLSEHGCQIDVTDTASRAVQQAHRHGRSGRCALALVPNDQLDRAMPELTSLVQSGLAHGGAMCIVLEDRPSAMPASCPRRAAARLDMATLEPADLGQLRDMLAVGLRMSRGAEQATAIVVHESILRSMMTLEMRPNRVGDSVPILRADRRRQRRLRFSESKDVLRLARRLELNSSRALPNPGERVPIGFVTVGPADEALRHLTHVLKLHGRIATLALGLLHPLDEVAIGRLLTRCDRVVVLEPRPGSMEVMLLQAAERLRRGDESVAAIWGRRIPADANDVEPIMESDDDLHPSILVRKIQHLLQEIRPTLRMVDELAPPAPMIGICGESARPNQNMHRVMAHLNAQLSDTDRWLGERHNDTGEPQPRRALAINDDHWPSGDVDEVVIAETWTRSGFLETGIGAVAHAAASGRPWVMVICDIDVHGDQDVERLAKSAVPARHADRVQVQTVDIKQVVELRDILRDAAVRDDLTVIIVRDASPARFDDQVIARELREVDRLGFEPVQRVRWSAEQACAIRPLPLRLPAGEAVSAETAAVHTDMRVDELPERLGRQFRGRLRLLDEVIEVRRTRAPVPFWRGAESVAVPGQRPVHAQQSHWRAHIAGVRGAAPGLAVRVLCEAGRRMGYDVQCISRSSQAGPELSSWAQVLFSRRDSNATDSSLTVSIPYGEADLLIGLAGEETVHALDGTHDLRVGSAQRTYLVANTGAFAGVMHESDTLGAERAIRSALGQCVRPDHAFLQNVAGACRAGFYSDRVADMVLLGVAFQRGMIPVSYASMVSALQTAESAGVGRAMETFDFGRRLAEEPQLLSRPRMERTESVDEMRRRMRLSLSHSRWRGRKPAMRFDHLVDTCLRGMPGLTETDAGRQARRDMVAALYRCLLWGGAKYAERFADLIVQLYHADRGDTGRALTRLAILPLAEAMLIRDPLYIATMTTCGEHRRRLRQQLNVKPARGDQLDRRFLVRLELSVGHKRYRADTRMSDWIARLMAAARRIVPTGIRGSKRDREVRQAVTSIVNQARFDPPEQYDRNMQLMVLLHGLAEEEQLRATPAAQLRALLSRDGGTVRDHRESVEDRDAATEEAAGDVHDSPQESTVVEEADARSTGGARH